MVEDAKPLQRENAVRESLIIDRAGMGRNAPCDERARSGRVGSDRDASDESDEVGHHLRQRHLTVVRLKSALIHQTKVSIDTKV